MDTRSKLVAALLLAFSGWSYAGYAQLAAPAGWTQGSGAASTFNFSKVAANDATFLANTVRTNAALNVGGRAITMPVAMRFAANAGRVGAAASFGNPGLFAVLAVGSAGYAAYEWYTDNGIVVKDGKWKKDNSIEGEICTTACLEWSPYDSAGGWYKGSAAAAQAVADWAAPRACPSNGSNCSSLVVRIDFQAYPIKVWIVETYDLNTGGTGSSDLSYSIVSRPTDAYNTGETKYDELTRQQFEDEMALRALPNGVPKYFPVPGVEWPLEPLPIVNPSPGANPVPQPLRVPMGEPQPVPNSNPPQWKTPVVDVVPSPTISEPFRVDIQPKDLTKTDAEPLPDTAPVPETPASGTSADEKTPDLCEKNPDILACQKVTLGDLEPSVIDNSDKTLSITKNGGWGPENGTCPAPKTAMIMGVSLSMPFTMLCDFASGIKPLLLAFAWLSATLTFLGLSRKD
ncbi:virulence factor TspB C-terminal domain-related protein [Rhodoferax ferrireducens]|uniref:virulence factor TspB C-terminal domain-related protein n=1 Tax=Rhodoferax ferrireducens TaxID=192843 RepID=UPI000E0DDF98|nr:virulence factor TspB C-terminal domain-related protein [Rhodoferax ferrireducens]